MVYNKADKCDPDVIPFFRPDEGVKISAKTGEGVDALLAAYGSSVPVSEREIAALLASRLTKAKILGTIDLLQEYRSKCTYNVGVGPTLGGFAVELEETL